MSDLQLIITNAGAAALANVGEFGPVALATVKVGTGVWTPDATATALMTPVATFPAVGSVAINAGMIHITAEDTSGDSYAATEVGIFTSAGVLFAVYSQASAFLTKTAGSFGLFACDFIISGLPPASVTVGTATFEYPPATETTPGVAEIATQVEVDAGVDDTRIVTPATLNNWPGSNPLILAVLEFLYPVNEIYVTHRGGNPAGLLGFGTWVPYAQGQTLVGYKSGDANFGALDQTGGEVAHDLTTGEMPAHAHNFNLTIQENAGSQMQDGGESGYAFVANTSSVALEVEPTGGGGAHNNLQPYTTVYYWRRTA